MKKCLFILLFTIFAGGWVGAGTFGFGMVFGAHSTWASGSGWDDFLSDNYDDLSTTDSMGFNGGLYFNYSFNKYFAVQVEALAAENGWVGEGTDAGDEVSFSLYYFKLDFPILVKGMIPLWRGSLYGVAGPVLIVPLFNLSASEERNGVVTEFPETEIDTNFHVGLTAGIGYELYLKKWCFAFDVRYVRTFKGLLDVQYYNETDLNTLYLALSVGRRY